MLKCRWGSIFERIMFYEKICFKTCAERPSSIFIRWDITLFIQCPKVLHFRTSNGPIREPYFNKYVNLKATRSVPNCRIDKSSSPSDAPGSRIFSALRIITVRQARDRTEIGLWNSARDRTETCRIWSN